MCPGDTGQDAPHRKGDTFMLRPFLTSMTYFKSNHLSESGFLKSLECFSEAKGRVSDASVA